MKKIKQLRELAFGDPTKLEIEELLIIALSFVGFATSLFGMICNIVLNLSLALILTTAVSSLWFGFSFYAARVKHWYLFAKNFTAFALIAMLDFMWVFNAGSFGPISLVFVSAFAIFLFLWDGWQRIIYMIGFVFNFFILFCIENYYPHLITPYIFPSERNVDFYTGFIINISASAVFVIYIKKLYIRERMKAIESEQLKTAFLANLSHEIRTPMNGIIGFARMLNKPNLTEEKRKKYTEIIIDNSQNLLIMINDVLDMSKLEAGQVSISKYWVNIELITSKLFQFYELKTIEKELEFIYDNKIERRDFQLYTDEQKLWQVLHNLLSNAVKFTAAGSITFTCWIEKEELMFSIADTGIGIEKKYHALVFERFRQVELTKTKLLGGTGLGLSICKNLVSLLGGRIWLESTQGKGTTFFVALPITAENPVL